MRGGLLPRPLPESLPVLLGAFSRFVFILFSKSRNKSASSTEPGTNTRAARKSEFASRPPVTGADFGAAFEGFPACTSQASQRRWLRLFAAKVPALLRHLPTVRLVLRSFGYPCLGVLCCEPRVCMARLNRRRYEIGKARMSSTAKATRTATAATLPKGLQLAIRRYGCARSPLSWTPRSCLDTPPSGDSHTRRLFLIARPSPIL